MLPNYESILSASCKLRVEKLVAAGVEPLLVAKLRISLLKGIPPYISLLIESRNPKEREAMLYKFADLLIENASGSLSLSSRDLLERLKYEIYAELAYEISVSRLLSLFRDASSWRCALEQPIIDGYYFGILKGKCTIQKIEYRKFGGNSNWLDFSSSEDVTGRLLIWKGSV